MNVSRTSIFNSLRSCFSGFALLAVVLAPAAAPGAASTVTVNADQRWGVWEGWGTSLCWWGNAFGDRDDFADLFFTTNYTDYKGSSRPGLGMNIVRYNAGACSSNTVGGQTMVVPDGTTPAKMIEGFWLNPASTDPASPSWDWSRDANQRAMMLKARARGADRIELFSNSPMWWMLKNYNPWGQDDGSDNLASANFQKHALYLATIAKYAQTNWGITFDSVEPFNEPTGNPWAYCNFANASQESVIALLRSELDSRGLSGIPIAASDQTTFGSALSTWNSFSSATKSMVGLVTVHSYDPGGDRAALYSAVGSKPLWMSEHGDGDADGTTLAADLTRDIRELHATGWVYWQALDYGGWGLIQSDIATGWLGSPRDKYYVLAQYSRHVRPGMVIVDNNHANTVTAYDAANRRLVIVTANFGAAQTVTFNLSAFHQASGPARRWLTTPGTSDRYIRSTDIAVSSRQFSAAFPTNTVMTFEVENVYLEAPGPYYWDSDGATAGFGTATGTWGSSAFLGRDSTGAAVSGIAHTTTGDDVNFGSASATLASGTVNVTGSSQGFKTLTCASANPGRITLGDSSATLNIAGSTIAAHNAGAPALNIFPNLAGSGGLTIASGDVQFNGDNRYQGGTTIAVGATLRLSSANALPLDTDVTVQSGGLLSTAGEPSIHMGMGTLHLNGTAGNGALYDGNAGTGCVFTADSIVLQSDAGIGPKRAGFIINAPVSGAFGLTKVNNGTLILQRANAYAGLTTINAGVLQLGVNNAIRSGNDVALNGGTLDVNGKTQTLDQLTGSGSVLLGGGALTLGSGGSTFSFGGVISGAGSLTKSGAGMVTLSGTNTYTGTTTVSAGTLSGSGVINGPVSIGNGGALEAGTSTSLNEALTLNSNLTLAGTARFQIGKSGATPVSDRIVCAGNITYGGTLIVTNTTGAAWTTGDSFFLFTGSGTRTGNFTNIMVQPPLNGLNAVFNPTNGALIFTTSSGFTPMPVTFLATGAIWKYFALTNDLGTAWRSNSFNDVSWPSGPAMLGFGDANGLLPATVIASNRQWTTYFRRAFHVPKPGLVQSLDGRILRDDGAVVYLNGAEIWRDTNMPAGAITNATPALSALGGTNESLWLPLNLAPATLNLLVTGTNVLAIEVHQNAVTSSDLAMSFELTGTALVSTNTPLTLALNPGTLLLSWPADAGPFTLHSTTNLTPPVTWLPLTNTPILTNSEWRVMLPAATNGQRFFRLQTS